MPVLTLVFYPITAYQCNFIVLFGKITMFFYDILGIKMKCHRYVITDVGPGWLNELGR